MSCLSIYFNHNFEENLFWFFVLFHYSWLSYRFPCVRLLLWDNWRNTGGLKESFWEFFGRGNQLPKAQIWDSLKQRYLVQSRTGLFLSPSSSSPLVKAHFFPTSPYASHSVDFSLWPRKRQGNQISHHAC